MKLLKISPTEWIKDSRDKRELAVCEELGMEVVVMAKGKPGDLFRKDSEGGFPVYRFSTRPLGTARWLNIPNRILSLFTWGHYAKKFQADVISGHDLIGLLIGYLSTIGNPYKARLVYDAHEFELGRNAKRGKLSSFFVQKLECFLMTRCAFSMMVNDSIADEVQRIHHLKKRPVVVRNVTPYWDLSPAASTRMRDDILKQLHMPDDTFLVLYHGGITNDRGIENMLRAVARLPQTAAVVLGQADTEAYLSSLHFLCDELSVRERVLFHEAVPPDSLKNFVSAVDVSIIAVLPTFKSYYYMLPNKFFENIQGMTPVIVSDFPTISAIVDQYQIGLKVDPKNVDEIAAAIERLRTDRGFYNACKRNLKQAKEDLCWEKEKDVLENAYREIIK